MIYVNESLESWCQKHGLVPELKKCACCGESFKTIVPILMKGYAGLETPQHSCNPKYNSAIFTPITNESKKEWFKILSAS